MRHRVDGSLRGKVSYPALFSIGVLSSLGSIQAKAADLPLKGLSQLPTPLWTL